MTDIKISEMQELLPYNDQEGTGGVEEDDFLPIIDISATDPVDLNKKVKVSTLFENYAPINSPEFTGQPKVPTATLNSTDTGIITNIDWVNSKLATLNLSNLADVSSTSPTNGQGLIYNDTTNEWEPGSITTGGTGGGGGSNYIVENYDGNVPTTTGDAPSDYLIIGEGAFIAGLDLVPAFLGNTSDDSLVIGKNSSITNGRSALAIGPNSSVEGAENGIALGRLASVEGDTTLSGGIAIGNGAEVIDSENGLSVGPSSRTENGDSSVALGANAVVEADNSIQLGAGTNNTSDTLQFKDITLANTQGLYTNYTTPVNYTPVDNDNITSHLTAIDTALGSAGGSGSTEDYLAVNSTGTAPSASGTDAIALGQNAQSTNTVTIAIGQDAVAGGFAAFNTIAIGQAAIANRGNSIAVGSNSEAKGTDSISIGHDAEATNNNSTAIGEDAICSGEGSVQLGTGNNSVNASLQFRNTRVATSEGIYIPPTSGTPSIAPTAGTSRFDSSTNTLYIYNGTTWKSTVLT